jgi:DNA-binding MarR family transcriptional regulator
MGKRLEEEIIQKSFKDEFEKAYVNIQFTANQLNARFARNLRKFDISPEQFNILRILRGQFPKPAPLKLITERMIDKMSNTSRLVEKLRAKGMVERHINPNNRREVSIIITAKGLKVIEDASAQTDADRRATNNLTEAEAAQLNQLLDKMRQ